MSNISDLDAWIDESIRISAKHDYHPTAFVGMRARHGTVEAIKRLVSQGDIQSGFRRLKELGLKEWTIEQAVINFPGDFPNRELREAARWRLEQP
ncbi:hypothetical protein [Bradyrhizobium sp. NC92]|uniref:hypothetical protein n=1 Tax=Bradyrhizobium sp. (strain NC92) TaxID=55395 RepID=UPI0021A9A03A|nr:hypothetical protein [Bradyrhizobium sp. NC92]UWU68201.1 hypothetical protein N2602_34740 [Bradyrhizobium sp. NC92]